MMFEENFLKTVTVRFQENEYFKNVIFFQSISYKTRGWRKASLLFIQIFKIMDCHL